MQPMCTARKAISSSRSSAYSTAVKKTMSYSVTTPFISGRQSATRNTRYFSATAVTSTASACPLPCTPEPISTDCGSPDFRGFLFLSSLPRNAPECHLNYPFLVNICPFGRPRNLCRFPLYLRCTRTREEKPI